MACVGDGVEVGAGDGGGEFFGGFEVVLVLGAAEDEGGDVEAGEFGAEVEGGEFGEAGGEGPLAGGAEVFGRLGFAVGAAAGVHAGHEGGDQAGGHEAHEVALEGHAGGVSGAAGEDEARDPGRVVQGREHGDGGADGDADEVDRFRFVGDEVGDGEGRRFEAERAGLGAVAGEVGGDHLVALAERRDLRLPGAGA